MSYIWSMEREEPRGTGDRYLLMHWCIADVRARFMQIVDHTHHEYVEADESPHLDGLKSPRHKVTSRHESLRYGL